MTTTPPEAPPGPPPGPPPGSPPGPPPADEGPRVTRDEVRDLGRIRRTVGPDRKLAGVAGGLARHLDIDPVLLRVAFVVLVFFGGSGVLLYVACWLLLPADDNPRAPVHLDDRNRTFALIGVGALSALALLADSFGQWGFPWPLIGVAVVALVVLTFLDRDKAPRPIAPAVPHRQDPVTGHVVPAAPGTPVAVPAAYRPPPRNPRRRGPILFWFTAALAALAVGVLGIVDLAGAPVADSAYPAAVVGSCGVMLLVGAFFGRAGGLILVGLLASLVLLAATASGGLDSGDISSRPLSATAVPSHLDTDAGEIVLDLSGVQDLSALDGRTIDLETNIGRIEVIVPEGLSVRVDAQVDAAGRIVLFGNENGGVGVSSSRRYSAGPETPEISIEAHLSIGEIEIHEGGV
jgi:phage shock protein PspC (stress-responsive transcriptional regulator)